MFDILTMQWCRLINRICTQIHAMSYALVAMNGAYGRQEGHIASNATPSAINTAFRMGIGVGIHPAIVHAAR